MRGRALSVSVAVGLLAGCTTISDTAKAVASRVARYYREQGWIRRK